MLLALKAKLKNGLYPGISTITSQFVKMFGFKTSDFLFTN